MAQQDTPAAGSGQTPDQQMREFMDHEFNRQGSGLDDEIEALRKRALCGMFFTAANPQTPGHPDNFYFWRGFINALDAVRSGSASVLVARDTENSGYSPPGYFQRAFASLPAGIESASLADVQKFLVSNGVQITADLIPDSDLDVGQQIKDHAVAADHLNDEHATAGVDFDNGPEHLSSLHDGETAIVAGQGGAA